MAFDESELLESYLFQRYASLEELPEEIVVPMPLDGVDVLVGVLRESGQRKVKVSPKVRGERASLLELAAENAEHSFYERQRRLGNAHRGLDTLQRILALPRRPVRIECFDISNFGPQLMVGSRVSFKNGAPDKRQYRHYRVRGLSGPNDFGAMYQVLTRRLKRGLEERELPDLVVVDGGKGQLNSALAAARDLGIEELSVIGLAKSRVRRTRDEAGGTTHSAERIFFPGEKAPLELERSSAEYALLTRIRDEAHRFAVTYHRKLRRNEGLKSGLEGIPGVGPARRKALLRYFGSLRGVFDARPEELSKVPGIGERAGIQIWRALHPSEDV